MTTHASSDIRPRVSRDFDFLVGSWQVDHHRLVAPLTGSDEWLDSSDSTAAGYSHLDGAVSVEEICFPPFGSSGMSLRLYDAAAGEWSVYWVGSRDGLVGEPVRGRWEGGACHFLGDDEHADGTPMRVSYEWYDVTPTDARWQQGCSLDGEQTWETNWQMHFHRTAEQPGPVPSDHLPHVTSDFDFLTGTWEIHHRKLRSRLTGCTDWDEFDSVMEARTHLGGLVSVDESLLPHPAPYHGMTVRTYDVAAGEWVLHWLDSRDLRMDPTPMRGRWVDGVGEFVAEDVHEGVPILCRFLWTHPGEGSAAWEQAFSTDDGVTWETNWTMTHTRIG